MREVYGKPTTFKTSPAQEASAISYVTGPFSYITPWSYLIQAPDAVSDVTQFLAEPNFRNAYSTFVDIPAGLPKFIDDYTNIGGMIDDFISVTDN